MSPDNLRKLGEKPIPISFEPDEEGYYGRECHQMGCQRYFKMKLQNREEKSEGETLYCPYCGYKDKLNNFFTGDQIEYAKSIVSQLAYKAITDDLNKINIGRLIKLKVSNSPPPTNYYQEQQLETYVKCSTCSINYSIFGRFSFCPNCSYHNSYDILLLNLKLITEMITIIELSKSRPELLFKSYETVLEDVVATFDGFGRELTRIKGKETGFQALEAARTIVLNIFKIDLYNSLSSDEWCFVKEMFQKRHLIAHKMGIIDD